MDFDVVLMSCVAKGVRGTIQVRGGWGAYFQQINVCATTCCLWEAPL